MARLTDRIENPALRATTRVALKVAITIVAIVIAIIGGSLAGRLAGSFALHPLKLQPASQQSSHR